MRNFFAGLRHGIGFLIITAALSASALAQNYIGKTENTASDKSASGAKRAANVSGDKNEFSVWGAFAPDIPRLFSGSRRSSFGEFGFQYARRIASSRNVALKYTIDAIPLAILNYRRELLVRLSPNTLGYDRPRTTAYAVSLTPVGFQLNILRQRRIQPFITANAGFIIFNKSIPDDRSALRPDRRGRQFNYTLAGGGGVEFDADKERSYRVGFKFHHISNASTGNINPGFDQNLFYFGYTFKKF